jgi:HAD superfamily hydrolase (TIGR01509 family)
MNIIIPIGGKGERFVKEGYKESKHLIPIFNKLMIEYVIDNIKYNKDDYIFIICNEKNNIPFFTKHPNIIVIKINKETRGATETLMVGLDIIFAHYICHKKTLIVDCDTFYTTDIVSQFRKSTDNVVFYRKNRDQEPIYSYISFTDDSNNNIKDIKEKVKISDNANTGAYAFTDIHKFYEVAKYIVEMPTKWYNNEPYTSCVIKEMLITGEKIIGIELDSNTVISLGTPKELEYYKKGTFAFLFDLDGTLVLTDEIYFFIWETILKRYNLNMTTDIFKRYIEGNNDKYVINTLLSGIDISLEELSNMKNELFIGHIEKIKVIKGVPELMTQITRLGHKCCIVTNSNRIVANKIIRKIGIHDKIDFVISAEDSVNGKPSPEPYMNAIKKYDIPSNKCIIFEDSKSGILSAKSVNPLLLVGIETIYTKSELCKLGIIKTLKDYDNIDINDFININTNESTNDSGNYKKLKEYILHSYNNGNSSKEIINTIIIDNNKLKGGFIADIISIYLKSNIRDYNVVFKYEVSNTTILSIMANQLELYEREYYFYEYISPYVNVKIPQFHSIIKDDNGKNIGIILDNLLKTGKYRINLDLNIEKIDISLKIIENMVKLHTQFWNKDLKTAFPHLKMSNDKAFKPFMYNYIIENTNIFKEKWKYILSEDDFILYQNIMDNFQKIQDNFAKGDNLTLIHGDIKSPNIFYDVANNYEPCFIDWQHIAIGKGTQDLVFFIIESFDIENLYIYYPLFKNYYYKKLIENGIINYSYSEYENDIKESIFYIPFFTSVWFGSLTDDDLIDKNFPFFFIKKLFHLCNIVVENRAT